MLNIKPIDPEIKTYRKLIYCKDDKTPKSGKKVIDTNFSSILNRFTDYDKNKNALEHVKEIQYAKDLYSELYKLYDSTDQDIVKFKRSISTVVDVMCPYCGTLEDPYQIDHYMPRSKYPEFSIYSYNLIPSCATCNQRYKGNHFLKNGNDRMFFNPYFDDFIQDVEILKCEISTYRDYLKIDYKIDDSLKKSDVYKYNLMKNHFDIMRLGLRYNRLALREAFRRFKETHTEIDKKSQEFQWKNLTVHELKFDIDWRLNGIQSLNKNHWEKVFWSSLKECDEVLDLIVTKKLRIK